MTEEQDPQEVSPLRLSAPQSLHGMKAAITKDAIAIVTPTRDHMIWIMGRVVACSAYYAECPF